MVDIVSIVAMNTCLHILYKKFYKKKRCKLVKASRVLKSLVSFAYACQLFTVFALLTFFTSRYSLQFCSVSALALVRTYCFGSLCTWYCVVWRSVGLLLLLVAIAYIGIYNVEIIIRKTCCWTNGLYLMNKLF